MTRLDLRLIPSHPDHAGGLMFVGDSLRAFRLVSFALGTIVAGQVANRITLYGESPATFKHIAIGMKSVTRKFALVGVVVVASCSLLLGSLLAHAQTDPLPSWNDGPAKQSIIAFVRATTDQSSQKFVSPEARIATFDQDGALWVEHPMYTQVVYCLERVKLLVDKKPELKNVEPFKTALSGDREAIAKLTMPELEKILAATLSGMTVEQFGLDVKGWLAAAKHPRFKRPYTDLVYQPMLEVMQYLRANGYKTYIVTGGGQDFVRVYAEQVYGIPPEQVVGTAGGTLYGYDKSGRPTLTKDPKLLLNDNNAGKPEGIHLRRINQHTM